ncbi:MAG: T9SS C-terminal target domain-containing protein [Calditrichaeota bacterium]|nr:MAG: T9SS C-terminal target domain-containing protein [Calditrichota bacterium]
MLENSNLKKLTLVLILSLCVLAIGKSKKNQNKINLSGGPDSFGYTFFDSNEPNGPIYNFIDISQTGTLTNFTDTDDALELINLEAISTGKEFNFYGNLYTKILVSTNGWLTFDTTFSGNTIIDFPQTGPNNTIAILSEDLNPAANGDIFYLQDDVNGKLIIQWENVPFYNDATSNTRFQVILDYNFNNILFNFEEIIGTNTNLNSCKIGIEDSTGQVNLIYFDNSIPTNQLPFDDISVAFHFPQIINLLISSPTYNTTSAQNSSITFPIKFKNIGSVAETFQVGTNGTWNNSFMQNGIAISQTTLLQPLEEFNAELEINVPNGAVFDSVEIALTSIIDPNFIATKTYFISTPDTTKPAKITIQNCTLNADSILISWQKPSSNKDGTLLKDAAFYKIYRGANPQSLTSLSISPLQTSPNFLDTAPLAGANYYSITTIDLSGNESEFSNPILCNLVAPFGGPDSYGYAWKSSFDGSIQPNYVDISPFGTPIGLAGDDEIYTFNLPFNFPFYGIFYSQLRISTNGLISFSVVNSNATAYANTSIPNGATPNNFIAPFWDDLFVDDNAKVYSFYDSTAQKITFQWNGVRRYNEIEAFSNFFQVNLFQNGDIEFQYQNLNAQDLTSATIGIEDSTATNGLEIVFNNFFLQSNLAVKIFHLDVVPPEIHWVKGLPNTDNHTQSNEVFAKVSDFHSTVNPDSVELFWRTENLPFYFNEPMTLVSGDTFFAQIPPLQQLGANFEYYVSATDLTDSLNTSTTENDLKKFTVELFSPGAMQTEPSTNSIHLKWQEPENNDFELKFDDGTSEFQSIIPSLPSGLNNPANATFTTKFNLNKLPPQINYQLNSVKIFLTSGAIQGNQFRIKVFDNDGILQNEPGSLLYESAVFTQEQPFDVFKTIEIPDGLEIKDSIVFVGVEQIDSNPISLGGDKTLIAPYEFQPLTFFVKNLSTSWSNLEQIFPIYGEVIPMIRCYFSEFDTTQTLAYKSQNNIAATDTVSWQIVSYNLFKQNGIASSANEVLTNGSQIFSNLANEFIDTQIADSSVYSYTLTANYDVLGDTLESKPTNLLIVTTDGLVLSFDEHLNEKNTFRLAQNFPNPFNPSTIINYQLPNQNEAKLTIFNVLGQKVKEFEITKSEGFVIWNGTNNFGKKVSSGTYFYRLQSDNFTQTKKMLLLK